MRFYCVCIRCIGQSKMAMHKKGPAALFEGIGFWKYFFLGGGWGGLGSFLEEDMHGQT